MTFPGLLQIVVLLAVWIVATKPLGLYMARVFRGERTFLAPLLRPVERVVYRLCGVDERSEQRWTDYAGALLAFSFMSFALTYMIQRLQGMLPFNPMGFGTAAAPRDATAVTPDLAFNTAVSFMSNTNWQAYAGEATLSYFVQMAALTVQNFVSAAAGVAVAIAVVRGFARRQAATLGNFWVDLTRATLYVFLPLSLVFALFFCSQGVIQNFSRYAKVHTVEGATQVIAQGPVASQEAIKLIGTNGGGFMNANSSHPYENPTPLTGFVEIFLIFLVSAGLTYTFGEMVGDTRQGWALFAVMSLLFLAGAFAACYFEQSGNPILGDLGLETRPTRLAAGREHGRERSAVRDHVVGALCDCHNRRKLRRSEFNARQLHSARRTRSPFQHDDRRSHIWRNRSGAVRHALVCCPRGLYRRTDGRPNSRVSREEDRGQGGQDGDACPDCDGREHSCLQRRRLRHLIPERRLLEWAGSSRGEPEQRRTAWSIRDHLRLHQRYRQQRQRFRRD